MELPCHYCRTTHLTSTFQWVHTSLHTHCGVRSIRAQKSRRDPTLAWKTAAPIQMCAKTTGAVSGCACLKIWVCVNGIKMSLLLTTGSFGSGPSGFLTGIPTKR